MKKAQGLSLRTIIIAVIVLIVLVVLIVIFGSKIGSWTGSVKSCSASGGIADCSSDCEPGTLQQPEGSIFVNIPGTECDDEGRTDGKNKCCKLIYEGTGKSNSQSTGS